MNSWIPCRGNAPVRFRDRGYPGWGTDSLMNWLLRDVLRHIAFFAVFCGITEGWGTMRTSPEQWGKLKVLQAGACLYREVPG